VHWRPRREWFEANCTKLNAIANAGLALRGLKSVWERNRFIGGR
jgi:hypothetical protein